MSGSGRHGSDLRGNVLSLALPFRRGLRDHVRDRNRGGDVHGDVLPCETSSLYAHVRVHGIDHGYDFRDHVQHGHDGQNMPFLPDLLPILNC